MRKVLAIFLAAGITLSTSFAAANLAPEEVFGASCVRGAVPSAYETLKDCGEWFQVSAQNTSPTSVWGAHTPGHTASEYLPVRIPLELQTAVYQDKEANGCALVVSVRFKWNGVPGAVGPSETNKIVEIIPELFDIGAQPPTKGKKDSISLDFKTKSLGWTISWLASSTMTGKNGMGIGTESWNYNLAGSAELGRDSGRKSKGAIVVSDVQLHQDGLKDVLHYTSTVQFREAHNREKDQSFARTALKNIWYASEGQFLWTAKKSGSCGGAGVSVAASYFRTEQNRREACEFRVNNFDILAKTIIGWVPLAGTGAALAEIVLGQLTSVDARENDCLDQSGVKTTPYSGVLFP